ncbi:hypothetical protein [Phaeobacter inhibens]|uniref:hypothetical protein n=1 Tax=Phaeobacter inhibens TaxID=221822 RepID=UPI000AAA4F78|nr:hypothetical protein [Phaeobacter inhibens]WHP69104.1 hypothetical protein QMZ01_02645 [Phaeobacter inhibens]
MTPKSIPKALWIPVFLSACWQTDIARIQAAGEAVGEARAEQVLPELPEDCRRQSRSGVRVGDRLDVAVLKVDAALSGQNARTSRCANWYDHLRAGLRQDGPQ